MTIRLKLTLLIALLFLTGFGNALLIFMLGSSEEDSLNWVEHTQQVILTAAKFESSLKDTETGQRGYLLTQNEDYLEPYNYGLLLATSSLQQLKSLTQDNPVQQQRLDKLNQLMNLKLAELKRTVTLAQQDRNLTAALAIVNQNHGKQIMDKIRVSLQQFIAQEQQLLAQRQEKYQATKALVNLILMSELVLLIAIAFITFRFLSRSLFRPMSLLLDNTQKTERGEAIDAPKVSRKDEMGYLINQFYAMNKSIYNRTQHLERKAHHDQLTGLKNRTLLHQYLKQAIGNDEAHLTAIFFIDLNGFKKTNDTLGHDSGDAILIELAQRLQKTVRAQDHIFRIGGDEFIIILNGLTCRTTVPSIAQKIINATAKPMMYKQQQLPIELSIGISIAPDDSAIPSQLIKFADIAMYNAKKSPAEDFMFFAPSMLKHTNNEASCDIA